MKDTARLAGPSAAFAMAAAVTELFSTALAWAKDASPVLTREMNAMTGHNWITHGVADGILFVLLGLAGLRARIGERVSPASLLALLLAATIFAGVGLFAWYAVF